MIRTIVGLTATLLFVSQGQAQDTAFVKVLRSNSGSFTIENGHLKGPGGDMLSRAARDNQFMMVGEDHGIAELPLFVGALFDAAKPAGYRHLAVEIGPITGRRLETMMRAPDGQKEVDSFLGRYIPFSLPFFFWKEESQMLERVVKSLPGQSGVVWGLD